MKNRLYNQFEPKVTKLFKAVIGKSNIFVFRKRNSAIIIVIKRNINYLLVLTAKSIQWFSWELERDKAVIVTNHQCRESVKFSSYNAN